MAANLRFKIQGNLSLDRDVKRYLRHLASKAFDRAGTRIETRMTNLVRKTIQNDPTLDSLVSGQLQSDFGLTRELAAKAVTTIIEYITDSVVVSLVRGHNPKLVIDFSPNLLELSRLPIGSYTSKGGEIQWLRWLLYSGTQVVVREYQVIESDSPYSRSGRALMENVTGGVFRVDPAFSGTEFDNFITRALNSIDEPIEAIVMDEIVRALK